MTNPSSITLGTNHLVLYRNLDKATLLPNVNQAHLIIRRWWSAPKLVSGIYLTEAQEKWRLFFLGIKFSSELNILIGVGIFPFILSALWCIRILAVIHQDSTKTVNNICWALLSRTRCLGWQSMWVSFAQSRVTAMLCNQWLSTNIAICPIG